MHPLHPPSPSTDPVTGLQDRREFLHRLAAALERRGSDVSILAVRLDRPARLFARLGADLRARLLRDVGRRLVALVPLRAEVARLGDASFGILLHDRRGDRLRALAAEIRSTLAVSFRIDDLELVVSAGVGWAEAKGLRDPEALLAGCELALARAQESGLGNISSLNPETFEVSSRFRRIASALSRALAEDRVAPVYQPIIDLEQGRIAGFEALCRFDDPLLAATPPAEFIRVAEEAGLIHQLGLDMLARSCQDLPRLRGAAPGAYLAVNLSPAQLVDGFETDVQRVLQRARVPAEAVRFELTEGLRMDVDPERLQILLRLNADGVQVHIDDFGVGFSCVEFLRSSPLAAVKMDRSLIRADSGPGREVLRALLGLARARGIDAVVEGVEHAEDEALLRSWGCRYAQGFWFARPQPLEETVRAAERRTAGLA